MDLILLQIGEISIMKDMTTVASTMMTDEEKAEVEAQLNGGATPTPSTLGATTPPPATTTTPLTTTPPATATFAAPNGTSTSDATAPANPASTTAADATRPPLSEQPSSSLVIHTDAGATSPSQQPLSPAEQKLAAVAERERKRKLQAEQREKLREQEKERRRVMEERIKTLTTKMVDRLRPFVEAKHPGDKDDPETMAFEARIRREAEDLKLESFGVEVTSTYCIKRTYIDHMR